MSGLPRPRSNPNNPLTAGNTRQPSLFNFEKKMPVDTDRVLAGLTRAVEAHSISWPLKTRVCQEVLMPSSSLHCQKQLWKKWRQQTPIHLNREPLARDYLLSAPTIKGLEAIAWWTWMWPKLKYIWIIICTNNYALLAPEHLSTHKHVGGWGEGSMLAVQASEPELRSQSTHETGCSSTLCNPRLLQVRLEAEAGESLDPEGQLVGITQWWTIVTLSQTRLKVRMDS